MSFAFDVRKKLSGSASGRHPRHQQDDERDEHGKARDILENGFEKCPHGFMEEEEEKPEEAEKKEKGEAARHRSMDGRPPEPPRAGMDAFPGAADRVSHDHSVEHSRRPQAPCAEESFKRRVARPRKKGLRPETRHGPEEQQASPPEAACPKGKPSGFQALQEGALSGRVVYHQPHAPTLPSGAADGNFPQRGDARKGGPAWPSFRAWLYRGMVEEAKGLPGHG